MTHRKIRWRGKVTKLGYGGGFSQIIDKHTQIMPFHSPKFPALWNSSRAPLICLAGKPVHVPSSAWQSPSFHCKSGFSLSYPAVDRDHALTLLHVPTPVPNAYFWIKYRLKRREGIEAMVPFGLSWQTALSVYWSRGHSVCTRVCFNFYMGMPYLKAVVGQGLALGLWIDWGFCSSCVVLAKVSQPPDLSIVLCAWGWS